MEILLSVISGFRLRELLINKKILVLICRIYKMFNVLKLFEEITLIVCYVFVK